MKGRKCQSQISALDSDATKWIPFRVAVERSSLEFLSTGDAIGAEQKEQTFSVLLAN